MEKHPVESVMDTTLLHIKEMVDVNTVVGKPIFGEGGTIIIPLSKIGVGFVAGGAEYTQNTQKNTDKMPFGGGGGAGMSVAPCGFLVINSGNVSYLSAQSNDALDKVINKLPQILHEVKDIMTDLNLFGDESDEYL